MYGRLKRKATRNGCSAKRVESNLPVSYKSPAQGEGSAKNDSEKRPATYVAYNEAVCRRSLEAVPYDLHKAE